MDFVENELSFKWTTEISDISKSEWDSIYNDDILNSYDFFRSMSLSDFENVTFSYLVIHDKKKIFCIIPCFTYLLDIYHISSNDFIKKVIRLVRKLFSGFLKKKVFIVGSYVSTCEHHIGILEGLPQYIIVKIRNIASKEIKNRSKQEKSSLTLIKEVSEEKIAEMKLFFDSDIHFFEEYPRTVIPVSDCLGSYPSFLKKKHRKTYNKYIARFESLYEWEVVEDYEHLIPLFYELYKKVWKKSATKFELLNEAYFNYLMKYIPAQTFCLIAKDHQGEIRLIEILLEDKDKLIPFYLGIDYTGENSTLLYLNNIYRTMKEAEVRKKSIVELGQTAYYPKIMSGAFVEKMYLGFYSYNKFWKFLIEHIFKYVFTSIETYPNVYLEAYKNIAKEHCTAMGYKIYN